MSPSDVDGPLADSGVRSTGRGFVSVAVWASVLPAVLSETRALRTALHHAVGTRRCDLRVTAPLVDGAAARIDGDCACRDFLVDMVVEAHLLLVRDDGLRNPPGAVRTHLRTRAIGDWIRRRRVEMGAQARCDRVRTGARGRALPDDYHRALLEFVVDEAGSPATLDGHPDLVLRLAARAAAEFGGGSADHRDRVAACLPEVERVCRTGPRVNVGTTEAPEFVTWWERFVERPLGRRPRRSLQPLPDSPGHGRAEPCIPEGDDLAAAVGPPSDDEVVERLVAALRRCPDAPETALRDGLSDLVAHGIVPARTAASVLGDRARRSTAARELSALA